MTVTDRQSQRVMEDIAADDALRWQQIDAETVAIRIAPSLQMTIRGLGIAIRSLPYQESRKYRSFRWAGEFERDGERWGLIRVTA